MHLGRDYDTSAKQRHTWWTNSTTEAYKAVKQCIIDAYSGITMGPFRSLANKDKVVTIAVNAKAYSLEALAETSGVRFAYKAFKQWEKNNRVERRAPGLSNSNDQMFFVAYAQTRCYNRTPRKAYTLAYQRHVQEDIMVNMALSQVPEFKQAFQCPDNSKMVAKKLCTMYN